MDFKEEQKSQKITTGKTGKGFIPKIFKNKAFLVFILFFVFSLVGSGLGIFFGILNTTDELTIDDLEFKSLTTIFLDRDGKEIEKVYGYQNRIAVRYNEISPQLPNAFVSIEDERFYNHNGVDIKRFFGAVFNYIIPGGKHFGGSTITQQLVKNITGDDEVSIRRKIQEQKRAMMLEQKLSKKQILELYLNTIYLGEGAHGVQTAAKTYFNKNAKELSIAECALIAGITQFPSRYDPFKNFEASKKRQETVLLKMKQLGYITQDEYEQAANEKIELKKGVVKNVVKQSYFIDTVCDAVLKDLQSELGLSKEEAQNKVFNEGLKVYTTMDSKVQDAIDEAYSDSNKIFSQYKNNTIKPQAAIAVIDHTNGYVVGLAGGAWEKVGARTFNRAVQAKRQPGSSIKPIAVYGPALDVGIITAGTVIDDVPITIGNWSPRNWYKDGFWGLSTIRRAIENSMNIVAVKVWLKVGPDRSTQYLEELGIDTLTPTDRESPAALALGGLTIGVSPLQMAAAYGAIANGGYYCEPITYTKVEDKTGRVLLEKQSKSKKVFDERAAYILINMMEDVVKNGTGGSARLSSMPVAGKTGTTSNNYDRWFVGFTPYYVGASWFGYDKQKVISGSSNYAATLWKNVMEKAHKGLNSKSFSRAEGIVEVPICIDSGKRPSNACYNDPRGGRVRKEMFIEETEPTDTCGVHQNVRICTASGKLAKDTCPAENVVNRIKIKRIDPYVPASSDAPQPKDKKYEAPRSYCDVH